jgi:hypothetical protein
MYLMPAIARRPDFAQEESPVYDTRRPEPVRDKADEW